jgi:penicillin-binding protein 1B
MLAKRANLARLGKLLGLTRTKWALVALVLATITGLGALALVVYTATELRRFERAETRRGTLVYAGGQWLGPGVNLRAVDLAGSLARLRYAEMRARPTAPGQFQRSSSAWEIVLRATPESGRREPQRVRLETRDDRITRVLADGRAIAGANLDPEVLTSIDDRPGEEYRPVRLGEVPITLLSAVLAAEDHRFFEHAGLDLRGVFRAAWINLRAGRVTQGGSTITQQLVKNRLLSARRSYVRKLREAWLAALVEWRYPKERIFEAYLNEIYLGQRGPLAVRGVGAAARAYFRKEVHQITLAEAALLAGMARAPNTYSPLLNPERARERRDVILARMLELGKIVEAEHAAARREPLRVQGTGTAGQSAPYFSDRVRQEVEDLLGGSVGGRGARVATTLDLSLQRFAEVAVARGLERLEARNPKLRRAAAGDRVQAALVVLDPATGGIRALVGGRDYLVSQFNRAVLARRQPGSAFKPFVFAAALAERGGQPAFTAASVVDDEPIAMTSGNKPWSPRNYDDRYEGRVTVRRALEQSLNAATIRIALEIGLPEVIQTAQRLGLTGDLAPVPSVALGAFEVTPLELARAYLPFVNGGTRPGPSSTVRSVSDSGGAEIPVTRTPPTTVMTPAEAYLMTSLLAGVVTSGTAASARAQGLTGDLAGKTGTTNDARDAWFVGYSPALLALVWVGFDDNTPLGLSGAQAALPIWVDFMKQVATAYGTTRAFEVPAGISVAQIDPTNGKLATRYCPTTAQEVFLTGTEPSVCTDHVGSVPDQVGDWWRRFRDWLRR